MTRKNDLTTGGADIPQIGKSGSKAELTPQPREAASASHTVAL
jgi:hypothetical protein